MRLYRLSRSSHLPQAAPTSRPPSMFYTQDTTIKQPSSSPQELATGHSPSRPLTYIIRILAIFCLLGSIALTLVPLLPSPLIPLFSIAPTGLARAESPNVTTGRIGAAWGLDRENRIGVETAPDLAVNATSSEMVTIDGEEYLNGLTYVDKRFKRATHTYVGDDDDYVDDVEDSLETAEGVKVPGKTYIATDPLDESSIPVSTDTPATPNHTIGVISVPPMLLWLGETGPEVDVGVVAVCLKITEYSNRVCTLISEYEVGAENSYLPLALQPALTYYPTTSPGPIILIISIFFQLLTLLIYISDFIPWARLFSSCHGRRQKVWEKHIDSDAESLRTLVDPAPLSRGKGQRKPYAFFVFWLFAFGFAIGSVTAILVNVTKAKRSWVKEVGDDVGMVFTVQPATILIALILPTLLIAGLMGILPALIQLIRGRRSDRPLQPFKTPRTTVTEPGKASSLADLVNNWERYHGPINDNEVKKQVVGGRTRANSSVSSVTEVETGEKRNTFGVEQEDGFHWEFKGGSHGT